jgi:hypothetical protein
MKKSTTAASSFRSKAAVCILGAAMFGLLPATAFAATSTAPASGTNPGASTAGQGPSTSGQTESNPHCTTTDLPAAKVLVEALLKERVVTLEELTASVSRARDVTASDKAELQSELASDLAGMQGLEQQVPNDTTCAELVANAETMVFDYRVYLLMTPKTDLVIVSDTESAITSTVGRWEPGIQAAITYAADHGRDVAGAQQALADLKTQLSDALATLQGVSATVLAQTPAGSPGNHAVFLEARNKCETVSGELRTVRQDLATILTVV